MTVENEILSESINIVDQIASAYNSIISVVSNAPGYRNFNDLNKKASENALTMYGLVSSNIPEDLYNTLSKGMETKLAALIRTIANNYLGKDIEEAKKYIIRNLTDIGADVTMLDRAASAQSFAAKLTEDSLDDLDLGTPLLENMVNVVKGNPPVANPTNKGKPKLTNVDGATGSVFMSPGSVFTFEVAGMNNNKDATKLVVSVLIRVNLISVDSDRLVTALVDSHESDNFQQYLKYRAKNTSFFRDFLLSIDTINKQVDRENSKNLEDRVVGRLMRKSAKTSATQFILNNEVRNFIVFLDRSDVDHLQRENNLVLTNGGTLNTLFKNLNMLSLCVADTAKRKAIMFDSDRPLDMQVFPLDALANEKKMMEMFSRAFN